MANDVCEWMTGRMSDSTDERMGVETERWIFEKEVKPQIAFKWCSWRLIARMNGGRER